MTRNACTKRIPSESEADGIVARSIKFSRHENAVTNLFGLERMIVLVRVCVCRAREISTDSLSKYESDCDRLSY